MSRVSQEEKPLFIVMEKQKLLARPVTVSLYKEMRKRADHTAQSPSDCEEQDGDISCSLFGVLSPDAGLFCLCLICVTWAFGR